MKFILSLIVLFSTSAFAQYGDAYHKPNEYALQEQKWRASRPPSSSSSYSPSYTTTKSRNLNPMTLEEYYGLRKKNSSRTVDPKEKQEAAKNAAPKGYYEQIAEKYKMDADDIAGLKHWDMAKPFEMSFTAKGLHKGEATFLSRLLYKVVSTKKGYEVVFIPNQNILNTATAYELFQKYAETGTFEQLMDYVFDFRYASLSALTALNKLEQRFPEKRDVILLAKVFPALYAVKSLLYTFYTTKEMNKINEVLQTLYDEIPHAAYAEDNYVGYVVGYNEVPPFENLYEEALRNKNYVKAREVAMVSLLTDSTHFDNHIWKFAYRLKNSKISRYKAPKVPIFTVDDIIAIHNHNKNAPKYEARDLSLFIYKFPKAQQLHILKQIGLSEEGFNQYIKVNAQ